MLTTLHLTKEEQIKFDALSEVVRDGWKVEEEILSSYETDEELRIRANMARFDNYPELKDLLNNARAGKDVGDVDIKSFSLIEEALPEFCFAIGARGVSMLIAGILKVMQTDEDVQGLAAFSVIRHDLLVNNNEISYN